MILSTVIPAKTLLYDQTHYNNNMVMITVYSNNNNNNVCNLYQYCAGHVNI